MPATATGNREKLLRGAVECLRERGYANTTARDLVAASGANLASIGYHFGGKEALLNEAVAENARTWMRSIEDDLSSAPSGSPSDGLRRTFAATVDRFDEIEPFLRSFVEAFPPAVRSDDLRATMAEAYDDVRDAGADAIARMFPEGGAPPRERCRILASMMIALCDGLILQWLLDPEAVPSGDEMLAALGLEGAP